MPCMYFVNKYVTKTLFLAHALLVQNFPPSSTISMHLILDLSLSMNLRKVQLIKKYLVGMWILGKHFQHRKDNFCSCVDSNSGFLIYSCQCQLDHQHVHPSIFQIDWLEVFFQHWIYQTKKWEKITIAIIFHTVEQIGLKKVAMQFRLLAPLWRHCRCFFLIFSTSQLFTFYMHGAVCSTVCNIIAIVEKIAF